MGHTLRLRIVEGFDGSWIVLRGADGRMHQVDKRAYEPGPDEHLVGEAVRRMRAEFDEWGAERWCRHYGIDRDALGADDAEG